MKPMLRKGARFRDQMLAAAKSDFEPDILMSAIEEVGESGRRGIFDIDRTDAAAGCRSGRPGARRSFVALAAAEERAMRVPGRRRPA